MTISSVIRKAGPFTGDGVTVAFPFTFKVFAAADLVVTQVVVATGAETTLALTTNYTVAMNSDQNVNPGGTVTMLVAPTATTTLTLTSSLAYLQPTDLTNQGGFYPAVINTALDRLTIFAQQLAEKLARSLKLAVTDTASGDLPAAAARANKLLGFDSSGNPIVVTPTAGTATALSVALAASSGAGLVGYVSAGAGTPTLTAATALDISTRLIAPNSYNHGSVPVPETTRGMLVNQGPFSGVKLSTEPNEVDFNLFKITGDQIDVQGGGGAATKANGLAVLHRFGGSASTGGRHASYSYLQLTAATSATSTDRNYVASQGWAQASSNDGGTSGLAKGALFGGSFQSQLDLGATYFANITACEFNTYVSAGTAPAYRSGIQIASRDADRGTVTDAMISLSDISSTSAGKWLTGILIGAQNSQHPLDTTNGVILKTVGISTIKDVIDVSSYTVTGSLFRSAYVDLKEGSFGIGSANASLELGSKSTSNTPFIDFNSSGGAFDYDARIIASGGGVSAGKGALTFQCGVVLAPLDFRVAMNASYANDAAAAVGGIAITGLYRNGSVVQIRVS